MTPRERLQNALNGKAVDRIPYSPLLAYFWDFQPKSVQEKGQLAYLEAMGADPLIRGFDHLDDSVIRLDKICYKTCAVRKEENGNKRFVTYETPHGNLTVEYTYVPQSNTWFLTKHPVQKPEDLKLLLYLYEHTEVQKNDEAFQRLAFLQKDLGERGFYFADLGAQIKTALQKMMEYWVGLENTFFWLLDGEDLMDSCLEALQDYNRKTVEITSQSTAEALIFWEDTSTTMVSPPYYEEYIAPEITNWSNIVHRQNKKLVQHACGHLKDLLPIMKETGIDAIDSLSTAPTGNVDMLDAIDLLSPDICIIGGIDAVSLYTLSDEELKAHISSIRKKMMNTGFIFANSDSCPPQATWERFIQIKELLHSN